MNSLRKKHLDKLSTPIERSNGRKNGNETRTRILHVAERLFAERGIDAVSLREIMRVAEVNISLINYHFGNKKGLLRAIFARYVEPLNRERMAMLEQAERDGNPASLEDLLRIFFVPVLNVSLPGPNSRSKQFGRLFSDKSLLVHQLITKFFDEFQYRFINALRRTLPGLSDTDLYWRLHCLLCISIQTPLNSERIYKLSNGLCRIYRSEDVFKELLPMLVAMLQASVLPKRAARSYGVRHLRS